MPRRTSAFSMSIAVYVAGVSATKVLDKNPYRLLYSIQNLDAANYIALSPNSNVTAGVYGLLEGQHLTAGQPMSDDTDQAEVWAVADTLPVNIAVIEISEMPEEPVKDNPRAGALRPERPRVLRREARVW